MRTTVNQPGNTPKARLSPFSRCGCDQQGSLYGSILQKRRRGTSEDADPEVGRSLVGSNSVASTEEEVHTR